MGEEGPREEIAETEGVEHGGMGGEIAAPAHAHGGAYRDGIAVENALLGKLRNETEGSPYGSESGNGEGYEFGGGEPEEPFKYNVDVSCQGGQQTRTLVGGTAVGDGRHTGGIHRCLTTEGEHHHHGRDDEHAGDDGQTDVHTALSTIEEGVEGADKGGVGGGFVLRFRTYGSLSRCHVLSSFVAGRLLAV